MQAWCVDCRQLSPKTETIYELGAEGWRVVGSANGAHFEWRCPACWLAFKELMWEASASSARFRAAAAIESRGSSSPPPPLERTGGQATYSDDAPDTNHDNRLTMIASVIGDVFRVLAPVLSATPAS